MPEQNRNFPFAHRLPTDVATEIRRTAQGPAIVEMGSPRARLAALVLVLGIFGAGLAAGLPGTDTSAMRRSDCGPGWVVDAFGNVTADENFGC